MKIFFSILCVGLLLGTGSAARACKYCQMAASADPEGARLSAQIGGQDFPLEGVGDRYQSAAPSATLVVPPTAASVATKATDLPTTVIRRAPTPLPVLAVAKIAPTAKLGAGAPATSSHWADAGLLTLLAAGGLFFWRTRRAVAPLS